MLTRTSVTAVRLLIRLGRGGEDELVGLRQVAAELRVSSTYLMKTGRQLVRAGILHASRGKMGGVRLKRAAEEISLLAIVEACQGKVAGDFCREVDDVTRTCALHQAGVELYEAITGVMARWTLADLIRSPHPAVDVPGRRGCLLREGRL